MRRRGTKLRRILEKRRPGLANLAGGLLSAASGSKVQTLYVTSSRAGEGKTTVAALMAYGLSMIGNGGVALVEANTGALALQDFCELEGEPPGFFDYLLSRVPLEQTISTADPGGPVIIPAGTAAAIDAWMDAFDKAVFPQKLRELQERFGYVVFDGDPVLPSPTSTLHAHLFDAVIVVVECGRTKWEVAQIACDKLSRSGGNILGVVLNKRKYPIPAGLYGRV